jgi:hypothetical protein
MSAGEVRMYDKGTVIEVTVYDQDSAVVDLSATDLITFIFRKPTGAAVTKSATFVTDGTDGKAKYTTTVTDLDVAGDWQLQVLVQWTSTQWKSDIKNFLVLPNLPTI